MSKSQREGREQREAAGAASVARAGSEAEAGAGGRWSFLDGRGLDASGEIACPSWGSQKFVTQAAGQKYQGDVHGFWASRRSQECPRSVQEGPGAARRSLGTPRSSSEVARMSSRKIGKMSSEMRLAASERPKIDQIGLLAQWKMFIPFRSPP